MVRFTHPRGALPIWFLSLVGVFIRSYLASPLMKIIGALVLGGATLSWVADQAAQDESTVVVHVIEPDVIVTVGNRSFANDRPFGVIECQLQPGRYLLRMQRGDRILHEEWFTAMRREDVVLVAWAPR
jgi:hypothetical protein